MTVPRSYDDPCGIARALDRIGERWALLIVRELLLGPRRFTDLRTGLPGASPNVLSQRLEELQAAAIIQRRTLPPPASSAVYELTPWGHELEPVILSLARWGSRAVPVPKGDLSTSALIFALQTTFDADAADGLRAGIALTIDGEPFRVEVARKKLSITRGDDARADATIETTARALRAVAFGIKALREVERDLVIGGDAALAKQFLALFRRPT